MIHILWLGVQVEPAIGAARYALLLAELWLVQGALVCAWSAAGASVPSFAPSVAELFHLHCIMGFSAVVCGLAIVLDFSEYRWQVEGHLPWFGRFSAPPRVRPAVTHLYEN
jgi:hypothetical protein